MTATMKKYADVVRAYLDGAEVQCRLIRDKGKWLDISEPKWDECTEYRIKPKEPRIVEKYIPVGFAKEHGNTYHHTNGVRNDRPETSQFLDGCIEQWSVIANIKIRCNEETGEIISVELVKESK